MLLHPLDAPVKTYFGHYPLPYWQPSLLPLSPCAQLLFPNITLPNLTWNASSLFIANHETAYISCPRGKFSAVQNTKHKQLCINLYGYNIPKYLVSTGIEVKCMIYPLICFADFFAEEHHQTNGNSEQFLPAISSPCFFFAVCFCIFLSHSYLPVIKPYNKNIFSGHHSNHRVGNHMIRD